MLGLQWQGAPSKDVPGEYRVRFPGKTTLDQCACLYAWAGANIFFLKSTLFFISPEKRQTSRGGTDIPTSIYKEGGLDQNPRNKKETRKENQLTRGICNYAYRICLERNQSSIMDVKPSTKLDPLVPQQKLILVYETKINFLKQLSCPSYQYL